MKQTVKHSIVAAILITLPNLLSASEGTSSDSSTTVTNQSTVNNVIVDQIKTTVIEESISSNEDQKSTQNRVSGYAGAQYLYSSNDTQIFNIPLGIGIGYGVGVEANIPVVFTKGIDWTTGQKESYSGLGDISAGLNYHFGIPASSGLSIITLLYKSTTGDEKKYLGSGADAYSLSYKYLKRVGGKYTLHLLGSYTLNNDFTNQFGSNIDYGDSYMAVIGGSMPCLLSDKVTTSAKLTYFHANENKVTYSGGGGYTYGETDITDLWIQWDSTKILSGLPLGFGVKIPLQHSVKNAPNPDKKFSFYLSASGLF